MPASGAPVLLDGVGVVNNPKSMEAASDFLNFLLQPQLQLTLARDYYQIPAIPLGNAERPEWLSAVDQGNAIDGRAGRNRRVEAYCLNPFRAGSRS